MVTIHIIYIYIDAIARISLMNVIKVRMQSSYMYGIIMRRILCTLLRGRMGMITIRYPCFHMFFYMTLYIFFFVLTYFRFPIKLCRVVAPKHVGTYTLLSTMNDRSHPHGRSPRNAFTRARTAVSGRRRYTRCRGIHYNMHCTFVHSENRLFRNRFTEIGDHFHGEFLSTFYPFTYVYYVTMLYCNVYRAVQSDSSDLKCSHKMFRFYTELK